jgi:hypothetical protein
MSSKKSTSRKETRWLNLVKDIYKNRENCPHRQSLKKVLKEASPLYCAETHETEKSIKTSSSDFTGNESGWLHLVKNILRNSDCKFHGKLKIVLKKASKVYCKPKTAKKSSSQRKTKKRNTSSTTSILKSIGLA